MRAFAAPTFASLLALGLGAFAATGCFVDVSRDPRGDDPTIDPQPIPAPACAAVHTTTESVFTRTTGPSVARFRFVAATPDTVLASSGVSVHRSLDEGQTWSLIDAAPLRGVLIQAMASLGDDLFVSVFPNDEGPGIFRSTDRGETWTSVATDAVYAPAYLSSDGSSLFAQQFGQTFQWNPVDATWTALPTSDNGFDVVESDGSFLYGNSIYAPGVYRLKLGDAAAQWQAVTDLPEWGYKAFTFDGARGFAANATQIFQTLDAGASWKEVSENAEVEDLLAVNGKVFAATYDGLRVSSDGGATWSAVGHDLFSTGFSLAATGNHVFTASESLRRATAEDVSLPAWQRLEPIGDTVYAIAATERAVLSMSEGHLLRSTDGGATWNEVFVDGDVANLSSAFVRHTADGDAVFALRYSGEGGVSIMRSTDDGLTFVSQGPGPGEDAYAYVNFLAQTEDGLVAGVTRGAGAGCTDVQDLTTTLYRSFDDGVTWAPAMNHFPETFTDCYGASYTPGIDGLSEADGALFATTHWKGTYRSTDAGATWHPIGTPESIGAVRHVTAAAPGVLVATASAGGIVRSTDGGATWSASGLGSLAVSSLVEDAGVVFATVAESDPSDAGVYASSDHGVTWDRIDAAFDARASGVALQGGRLFAATLDESVWTAPLACAP